MPTRGRSFHTSPKGAGALRRDRARLRRDRSRLPREEQRRDASLYRCELVGSIFLQNEAVPTISPQVMKSH